MWNWNVIAKAFVLQMLIVYITLTIWDRIESTNCWMRKKIRKRKYFVNVPSSALMIFFLRLIILRYKFFLQRRDSSQIEHFSSLQWPLLKLHAYIVAVSPLLLPSFGIPCCLRFEGDPSLSQTTWKASCNNQKGHFYATIDHLRH